ncbi:MAG: DNA-directed RNA polymerase subunit omega [Thermodesulfovibrionales bacterium]
MNIVSLPIEYDRSKIDGKYRIVAIASQRAKDLSLGAKPKIKTKAKKVTTISIEEAITNAIEFLTGEQAKKAKEEAKKLDYRRLLEEKMKETPAEEATELEKDLRVYLHERESTDRKGIEDLFSEKREEGFEE